MISVNSINKSFGDEKAVDDVSFEVKSGEIFGIVGPDGAGKSTLLRMLSTILTPDEGIITLKGKDIFENAYGTKEKIAYMPQRFGLYEDLTVEENIFFFGRLFGLSYRKIRDKLPVLYGFSNLEPFKKRPAGKLSGGMKQKLGLACCLVHDPEIILLDEPTNGVDPVSRREFWKILYDLLTEGITIIVSTAYLDEAERCGRVALMHNGSFISTGEPARIKSLTGMPLLEITCSDPVRGRAVLSKTKKYKNIIRTGASMRVFVSNRARDAKEISRILGGKKIKVSSIKMTEPSLEDTFVEVISQAGPA